MEETTVKVPTIQDKINVALDGRTQVWLVGKIKEYSNSLDGEDLEAKYKLSIFSDVKLSRRMNGYDEFEPYELTAISKILKIKL